MRKRLIVVLLAALVPSVVAWLAVAPLAERRLARGVTAEALKTLPHGDIERGRRLGTNVLVCTECHGSDLSGKVVVDWPVFAVVEAPNLTRGRGGLGVLTGGQWDLAVRHGLGLDGRALVLMPADGYARLSVEDLGDLVAWLSSLPPVDAVRGRPRLGPLGALAVFSGGLHVAAWTIDHIQVAKTAATEPIDTGPYLVQVSGCAGCHGQALGGRALGGGLPDAPSLIRDAGGRWTFEDFRQALTRGRARDGHVLNPVMPWRSFSTWSEAELRAVWEALPRAEARATR
jgi:mono/diheme cytochrome c family protein